MDAVAIALALLKETQGEPDPKLLTRRYVERGRRLLFERHRAGAGGLEVAVAWATVMDHLIRHLYALLNAEEIGRFPAAGRLALVAQGGYGRGELNPRSDIDLLFLHPWRVSPQAAKVTERLLHTLWDAGLQVGHASRSATECLRLAESDMKVRTALLDARFLCGDFELYGDFEKAVETRLLKRGLSRFLREKLAESKARHEEYGGSVYLLEPDVKEGQGGLRDIQTARWIARAKLKSGDLDSLALNGVLSAEDVAQLKESQDFLLRVRNELHFSTEKHQDQLTFEHQEQVSAALGFVEGEGSLRAVEVFMRAYYLHAAQVSRLASLIAHRLTDCGKSLFGAAYGFGRTLREGVRISRGHVALSKPQILEQRPENLLRIFDDAQKHGCQLSHETREELRRRAGLIDEEFRRSSTANEIFFGILRWKEAVYETLLEMHRSGVLGAFLPEFGRLTCMVLHDAYHIYTVDEHSLRLIKEVERLKAGDYLETLPLLTQLVREAEKIELLYLGMMLHDVGKGFGGGHSEIGARMARAIAHRMRLNADDGALVEFLVRHHLLMTHTAFRRDLEDPKTIFDFARTMGSVNNLKMLYLLTFADVKAVGPEVWNPWKASLLGELYVKSLNLLEEVEKGEFQRPDVRAMLRRIQARVRRQLREEHPEDRVEAFMENMPERYFISTPEKDIALHYELMERFRGRKPEIAVEHFPERDCSSVVICERDRPGLFASITGVFTALHLDILNARIFTGRDGRILDVFRISHHGRSEIVTAEQRWVKFRNTLEGVLEGKLDVVRLVEGAKSPLSPRKRAPKVSTVINIDNQLSDDFTVIEIFTEDRLGVLFAITHNLHRLGLSIHVAKISTNVDQVADVFYVTDGEGRKLDDPERLENIRHYMLQSLVPRDEGRERVA